MAESELPIFGAYPSLKTLVKNLPIINATTSDLEQGNLDTILELYIFCGQQILSDLGISAHDPLMQRVVERFSVLDPRTVQEYAARFGYGRRTGAGDEPQI